MYVDRQLIRPHLRLAIFRALSTAWQLLGAASGSCGPGVLETRMPHVALTEKHRDTAVDRGRRGQTVNSP